MAIVVTTQGGGGNKTSETQHQLGISADIAVDTLVLLAIVADNAGTSGVSSIATPTDTQGNTYTLVKDKNVTAGAALDGLTVALYKSVITTALTTAGSDRINYNFSPATVAKTYYCISVTGSATTPYATDSTSGSGTTYTSNTSPSMTSGDLYYGIVGNESATQPALDGDASNGSWVDTPGSGLTSAGSGGDATKMSSRGHRKIVTGSGTQTLNGATGANTDWAVVAALFHVPATSFVPALHRANYRIIR